MASKELLTDIVTWFANGSTGLSSKTMACAVVDIEHRDSTFGGDHHPRDPADLLRCIKFLEAVPRANKYLFKVAVVSPVWKGFIAHWDELTTMLEEEMREDNGRAPRTYKRMQEIIEKHTPKKRKKSK